MIEEVKEKASKSFFKRLDTQLESETEPSVARVLLGLLFPAFALAVEEAGKYRFIRKTTEETAADEKLICDADYFPIYFRATVPNEMASNAEVDQLVVDLNSATSESEVQRTFGEMLDAIPAYHPKRQDFLWKLGRASDRLNDTTLERLAYAAAARADSYGYDIVNIGEAARALNLVFHAAQRMAATPGAQRVLDRAMSMTSPKTPLRNVF